MGATGIKVTFRKDVTRADLVKALDQILHRYGCTACGLNGHGFTFTGEIVDPEIGVFQKTLAAEIKSVSAVQAG
jgi:hypothetical protein